MTPTAVPIPAVLPAIPAIAPWPSIINVSSPPRRCRAPAPLPSDWRTVTPAPPHSHTTKAYPKPKKIKRVNSRFFPFQTLSLSLSKHTTKNSTPRKTKTTTPTREEEKEGENPRNCASERRERETRRTQRKLPNGTDFTDSIIQRLGFVIRLGVPYVTFRAGISSSRAPCTFQKSGIGANCLVVSSILGTLP
jgi:hypothetical protein